MGSALSDFAITAKNVLNEAIEIGKKQALEQAREENPFYMEIVTPERAKELLKIKTPGWKNRPISDSVVDSYAKLMESGGWDFDANQALHVDENGTVIDGQHRLLALIKTNQTQKVWFCKTKNKCFSVFDSGKKRSISDALSCVGYKDSHRVAIAVNVFKTILEGLQVGERVNTKRFAIPFSEYINIVNSNSEIVEASEKYSHVKKKCPFFPEKIFYLIYFTCRHVDTSLADKFINDVLYGENLTKYSPGLVLREFFIKERLNEANNHPTNKVSVCFAIYCWNKLYKGESIKIVSKKYYLPEEGVCPKIFGYMNSKSPYSELYRAI